MSGQAAPTYGWDLVYAVRLPDVNARIASQNATFKNFEAVCNGVTVSGTFQPWRIVPGGSNYLVYLLLPIVDGRASGVGVAMDSFTAEVTVSIELRYVAEPVSDADTGAGSARQSLRICHQPSVGSGRQRAFSITGCRLNPAPDVLSGVYVQTAIQQWLDEHCEEFQHVFSVVDVAAVASEVAGEWLKPTQVSYAYVDATNERDCLLAMLAMTGGRDGTMLDQQAAPDAVMSGAEAALLISPYLLLHELLPKALVATFAGTAAKDFVAAPNQPSIGLAAPVQLSSITYEGQTFQPLLEALQIRFEGTQIYCQSKTSIPAGAGVTANTTVTVEQGVVLGTNAQGQKTLQFTEIGMPQVIHANTVDPDASNTAEAIGFAIGIGGAVASFFTAGIASVFILLGSALVGGVVANVPNFVADWTSAMAPALDLVGANLTSSFHWTGGAAFGISTADLAESVRLSGTPWRTASAEAGG